MMTEKEKILIVDDERFNITVLVDMLRENYETMVAKNGSQALSRIYSAAPPDLILLDIMMPEMDGYEVCHRLKTQKETQDIPIIFITALMDTNHEEKGLALGAVDYITKPFSPSIVLARIKSHLALSQTRRELAKKNQEYLNERALIENIILRMRSSEVFDPENLRFIQAPVEKTAGDLLLSTFRPDGAQHLLLGDFTGHGLSAAIGGPIVAGIFCVMTRKGFSLADIVTEINRQLYEKTPPNIFMAAGFVELDPSRRQVSLWNGSIPDILIVHDGILQTRIESNHLALGIIDNQAGIWTTLAVEPGDRIFAYSDGFIEEINTHGHMLGQTFFEEHLLKMVSQNEPLEVMTHILDRYRAGHRQSDDMTMVELTC